jgi:two-component system sensor histidine kinase VicK
MTLQDDENLKFFIKTAPMGICLLDAQTLVAEMINDKFLEIAGKPKEAILGKWYWEPFAEARAYYEDALAGVIKTRHPYYADEVKLMLIRHGREEWIFVTFVYAPVINDTGEITKVAVWVLENTNQVLEREKVAAAREAAEKERDRLYEFFRQAPAGICVLTGPQLHYELVNPTYQQLLPGRELMGRPIFEALPELIGTPLQQILLDVYHKAEAYELSEFLIPLSEDEGGPTQDRYFTFNYVPRLSLNGQVDGIFAFVYEVTGIIKSRIRIQESNEMLNLAVAAADLGIWSVAFPGEVLQISARAREIYGFEQNIEVTITDTLNQIIPEQRELVGNSMKSAIREKRPFHEQYLIQTTSGVQKWLSASGSARYDEKGRAIAVIGTLLDITEQKLDDLRKNDFISMVSHELKTPLTTLGAVIQMTGIKLKKNEDLFLVGAMETADRQLKKMSKMINGFLNISRLESGKIMIDKHPFDIEDLINEIIKEVSLSGNTHIIACKPFAPVIVVADREKIGSVISNLLSNAIKYSPTGTYISVNCDKTAGSVTVSVTDEGAGISPEDSRRIFERYYRVQNKNTQHVAGFGIGLYLSSEIIERHQGTIGLKSEPGKGSTFYFTIPLQDE